MSTVIENKKLARKLQSNREQLKSLIAGHPFVRGLSPLHVSTITDYAMTTQFEPGQLIFSEGELANRFYLLLDGEVVLENKVNRENLVLIETLGAGDVLGWSWMFEPYTWHFDARATRPTRAIFFYGTWLREFCDHNPELGYELMKRIAEVLIQRLQATRRQLGGALIFNVNSEKTARQNLKDSTPTKLE
jgi:CRP/FNR family transcriptional regulator, cyclic AMP receptor protein